ncbi:MAG: hypothetical protein Kow00127_22560 [Bacteroidales bacterium]
MLKQSLRFFLLSVSLVAGSFFAQTASGQILISLLLGDELNSGKIEFGVDGGFNRSWMSGNKDGGDPANSFTLGFYFDFKLNQQWYVNTGVHVKSQIKTRGHETYPVGNPEADSLWKDGSIERFIGYFYVPAHIKYRFRNNFYAMGGIQAGLKNSGFDNFYTSVTDKNDTRMKIDIRNEVTALDFGFSGSVGYKFRKTGLGVGATWYQGLVDALKDDRDLKNRSLYLYVTIPVGAGYKSKSN